MQVNQESIKRPKLIEPFFNEELTPQNEYVEYIHTNHSINVKKNVTPGSHDIKKSLKTKKFNIEGHEIRLYKKLGFYWIDICLVYRGHSIHVRRTRSRFGESTPKTKTSLRDIPIIELLKPYVLELYNKHEH